MVFFLLYITEGLVRSKQIPQWQIKLFCLFSDLVSP